MSVERVQTAVAGVDWRRLAVALPVGALLGVGAHLIVGFASGVAIPWLVVVWAGLFVAVVYRQPDVRAGLAAGLFYVAIEALLAPVALLVWTLRDVGGEGWLLSVGVGLVIVAVFWAVAWTVALVAYLLSGRIEGG